MSLLKRGLNANAYQQKKASVLLILQDTNGYIFGKNMIDNGTSNSETMFHISLFRNDIEHAHFFTEYSGVTDFDPHNEVEISDIDQRLEN